MVHWRYINKLQANRIHRVTISYALITAELIQKLDVMNYPKYQIHGEDGVHK